MNLTDRLLAIVIALQEKGWQRAADLGAALGVSTRTIYRDAAALSEAGVPVVGVPGKGYRLAEGYVLPALTLTTDEAVLLLLGTEDVDHRLGVAYQAAAASARKKLEDLLPDRLRSEAAALQKSLRYVPVNAFDNPAEQQALERLRLALAGQRAVRFREGEAGRVVHPYGLVHLGGAWHLLGYCRQRQRVLPFRLDRMEALAVLDETFERPEGYAARPAEPEAHRDLVVRVRFDAEAAPWVRQAPSAYLVETEDVPGGLLATLRVRRETEVLPWLLSWGAHAHVLEPLALQQRLAREAAALAARYGAAPTLLR